MKMWKEECKMCSHWFDEIQWCYWHKPKFYKKRCLHQNFNKKVLETRDSRRGEE